MSEQQLNAEQQKKLSELEGLLDGTLDDIEDLPGFIQLPTGAYKVLLAEGFRNKVISSEGKDHPAVDLPMTVKEIIELGNAEEAQEVKVNDVATLTWMMDNETGKGFFKEAIRPLYTHLNANSYNEAMKNSRGMEVIVVISRTFNKDKQRHFMQLKKLTVA